MNLKKMICLNIRKKVKRKLQIFEYFRRKRFIKATSGDTNRFAICQNRPNSRQPIKLRQIYHMF